jgi:glutathione synthase/RimK-type ligase-like ATP-grasp enzyme
MLLILSAPGDTHAVAVERILTRRRVPFIHWNQADFPDDNELTLRYDAGGLRARTLVRDGERIDFTGITSTYVRRFPHPSVKQPAADVAARTYVEGESRAFLQSTIELLDCRWVPGPMRTLQFAGDKILQLTLAARRGFEIPPTLITNSRSELLAFHREHNGQLICKALNFPNFPATNGVDRWAVSTQLVTPRDMGYASSIHACPAIFQAYIPKRLELRVTVVADQAFACEIHSQATHRTRHDWRRYDLERTPHRVHRLPDDVRDRCVRIVRELGLCYGAIDLVLTPDDRYVFLEVNPMGQYLWIEKMTGLPISEAICDLLEAAEAGDGGMSGA